MASDSGSGSGSGSASNPDVPFKSMTDNSSPLEYLMRYIDDEPNIYDNRFIIDVIDKTILTALGFAVVGQVDGATKLLDLLHRHGHNPFPNGKGDYVFLKPCMYFAWEATSSWPDWIPQSERTETNLRELKEKGRDAWLERYNGEWSVDEETAQKALVLADQAIPLVLPYGDGTLAGQVQQAEDIFSQHCQYAKSPNGPFQVRYLVRATWWRQGVFPHPWVQVYRSAGFAMAFDIYLRLGQKEKALKILEEMCKRFHTAEQLEMMACSRAAWQMLWSKPENPVLDLVGVHPGKVRPAVARAIALLETRLTKGPRRRFMNKSIEQLLHVISENTYRNCPYDAFLAPRPLPRPENKAGLLHSPCSSQEIVRLQEKLGVSLPLDYVELLSISNGLEDIWDGQQVLNFFCPVEKVTWHQPDYLIGCEFPLLHDGDPRAQEGNRLDWPDFTDAEKIRISEGDGGPGVWLIPKDVLQPGKDYFLDEYNKRTPKQKEELDRVVKETYGSMERFMELEWALVSWTSWGIEVVPYNGIHDMLERLAEQSLTKFRPWLYIFDPRLRTVK